MITPEMRAFIGVESAAATHDVEKGAVARFARAVGDPNPLYQDEVAARNSSYGGLIAPPTFLRSLLPGKYLTPFPEPFSYVLDGGSEYKFFAPLRVGDRVTVTRRVVDLFEKQGKLGTMLFRVQEIRYVNQLGELAAVQKTTTISYGAGKRDAAIDDL